MILRKTVAIFLVVVIALGIMSTLAFGYSAICNQVYEGKLCGSVIGPVYIGRTVDMQATHQYGGFLGFGVKTCTYTYYYNKYSYQCQNGHEDHREQYRHERGHSCGQ